MKYIETPRHLPHIIAWARLFGEQHVCVCVGSGKTSCTWLIWRCWKMTHDLKSHWSNRKSFFPDPRAMHPDPYFIKVRAVEPLSHLCSLINRCNFSPHCCAIHSELLGKQLHYLQWNEVNFAAASVLDRVAKLQGGSSLTQSSFMVRTWQLPSDFPLYVLYIKWVCGILTQALE